MIADIADRVVVMYAGRVVEQAGVDELFARPQHHYTAGLLSASPAPGRHAGTHRLQEIPGLVPVLSQPARRLHVRGALPAASERCSSQAPPCDPSAVARWPSPAARTPDSLLASPWRPAPPEPGGTSMSVFKRRTAQDDSPTTATSPPRPEQPSSEVVLELQDLVMHFGAVRAVDGVSLQIRRGKVTALVGESGSGKSTVGRCIVRLVEPTGRPRAAARCRRHSPVARRQMRAHRRDVSIVFQDPAGSLDPRMLVGDVVGRTPPAPGRKAVPQGAG